MRATASLRRDHVERNSIRRDFDRHDTALARVEFDRGARGRRGERVDARDPGAVAHAGKSRLETWVPPWSSHRKTLSTIGFAPDPSRFNLCIRVFGPPFDEAWAKEHWFYSMGDSDVY